MDNGSHRLVRQTPLCTGLLQHASTCLVYNFDNQSKDVIKAFSPQTALWSLKHWYDVCFRRSRVDCLKTPPAATEDISSAPAEDTDVTSPVSKHDIFWESGILFLPQRCNDFGIVLGTLKNHWFFKIARGNRQAHDEQRQGQMQRERKTSSTYHIINLWYFLYLLSHILLSGATQQEWPCHVTVSLCKKFSGNLDMPVYGCASFLFLSLLSSYFFSFTSLSLHQILGNHFQKFDLEKTVWLFLFFIYIIV